MSTIPEPCRYCGWQYPEDTLAAARRGEVTLDTNPTHLCTNEPCGVCFNARPVVGWRDGCGRLINVCDACATALNRTEPNHCGYVDYATGWITYTCGCVVYTVNTPTVPALIPDTCTIHPLAYPCGTLAVGGEVCLS